MLGQIAVVGMTVTDIYMAGQVSADDLAALQLGGSIWAMINLLVIGIMIGNSPIIGNFWGAGKTDRVRFQFQQGLWLALPMGVIVCGAILLGVFVLGRLDISPEVYRIARGYLLPYLITGFMFPAFFAFRATFEGIGDIRPVMVFNCLAFVLNGILRLYPGIRQTRLCPLWARHRCGLGNHLWFMVFFTAGPMVIYGRRASNLKHLPTIRGNFQHQAPRLSGDITASGYSHLFNYCC